MAAAYDARLAYPASTFEHLASLRAPDGADLPVLEIGAGNGRVTGGLVRCGLAPIDAVEPSQAMVDRAPPLAGVRWIVDTFEAADVAGPYGLAVAAEAIHWTDWTVSFPKLAKVLAEGAVLALVGQQESGAGEGRRGSQPWLRDLQALIARYATSYEYVPYDLPAELRDQGRWEELGSVVTPWEPRTQPIDDVIRRCHSMNGLSPEAMGDSLEAFDDALRELLASHADEDGLVHCDVAAEIRWGRPLG
jgi:SAM-dependent methyltransferase